MQTDLTIAILAGLGGMLGWGFADFFAKKTIDQIGDIVSLVWAHICGTVVLLIIWLYQLIFHGQAVLIPSDSKTWLLLIAFGALQATVYLLVYKGFGKGQLAILNPIFSSYSGLTSMISVVVFGEIVTGHLLISLFTIFLGILLLSVDIKALRLRNFSLSHIPGIKEIGLATILAALWTISWDKFVGGNDWLSYALFMYVFMTVTMLIVAKTEKINLSVSKPGCWKFLILIGLCETLAYLAISFGYSTTSFTSIVALLSGAFSLPTIFLARVFLKEKTTNLQLIASLIIVFGVILLSTV